ncbi:hypothetical protein A9K55_001957 [Cordyceps militaris]|uniref:Uncharacterized protein n=1 Tax=Cordyceps militaris TaxID=73501 RepID=A0A2H4SSI3_CORMI|nr:hypothetical protein A9K55_001957 [Cordyceps militaris]
MDGIIPILVGGLFKTAELLKNLKNAPTEILELAEDIEILSGVLIRFEEAFDTLEPSLADVDNRQSKHREGETLVKRIRTAVHSLTRCRDLVAINDASLLQKLIARLRWLFVKSSITAARHTIQVLSSLASLFVNSIICKHLRACVADLERDRAEVPTRLCLRLKAIVQECLRDERRVESASRGLDHVGEAALKDIGLHPADIRKLQRTARKTTEKERKAAKRAHRSTRHDDYFQQEQDDWSYGQDPDNYSSGRSPRIMIQTWNQNTCQGPLTPEVQVQMDAEPRTTRRSRPKRTPRRRPHAMATPPPRNGSEMTSSQSILESEPPEGSEPELGSPRSVSSFHTTNHGDISQPSATRVVPVPPKTVKRRHSRIHGSRVQDSAEAVIGEESEMPADYICPCARETTSFERSGTPEHGSSFGAAARPRDRGEASPTVLQDSSTHDEHRGPKKRTSKSRLGEQYKPCGLFTESDLEERRRRDRRASRRDESHTR